MYWEQEIETISQKALRELQLEKLIKTVAQAYKSPFYKKRLDSAGIKPESIQSLSDLKKIPFTTKDDLRSAYPDLMVAAPKNEMVRMHSSSGTTGQATVIFFTRKDLSTWTNLVSRSLYMAGMRPGDA